MTNQNKLSRLIPALEVREGAGVVVHRTIGTPTLRHYDPFMLLDHFETDNPGDYIAGFPSHPHRGFSTFTYMIDGHMEHKDSLGNTGNLTPGAAQWMKAASGVIHSEMPKQEKGLMRGFQLWINLPADNKMDEPEYQEYHANAFTTADATDYQVKVLIGQYGNINAPITDDITNTSYFDVQVNPSKTFQHTLTTENNSFIYIFEGSGKINGQEIMKHTLVSISSENNNFEFAASSTGARFLFVSGKPINEPIVQYGPFVMNSREEIEQALQDYQSNNFVKTKAWTNKKKSN